MPNRVHELWWEENKTRVWTVEVDSGNYVARRQDNDQINGTKLLNITRITRGKRDGILKNEKSRQVVKTGTISLKGVWIPLDRGLVLARQFGIEQLVYPLFEANVGEYVENSVVSQHAIKRKSLNSLHLVDNLTTNSALPASKRRSTVSTYRPNGHVNMQQTHVHPAHAHPHPHSLPHPHSILMSGSVSGSGSAGASTPSPYVDSFGYAPAYEQGQNQGQAHAHEEAPQYAGRSRNTSSASEWMTNWSASSSSPILPATPINGTFSPVMNTFQSLAMHSPPVPIPSYYYDSSSSYFPSYHQKQQQGERRVGMSGVNSMGGVGGVNNMNHLPNTLPPTLPNTPTQSHLSPNSNEYMHMAQ
ncbi:hypothetical protein E3P86_01427 [Wallemia ichthyophaga]|uniref:HTH APSES-type domain-containing protein n=1 Tax=Wallemia ichthyophaga TaxID=245174 RepID=A0A4T0J7K0_WALIC|nr:hypothetical protein E3P86_01427 [Wallemia ichthyophaga]